MAKPKEGYRKIPNEIEAFFHCAECMKELPRGVSPREWASLEAGWTKKGFQVWCKRHEINVVHVDFQGQKHPVSAASYEKERN